jgi:hypothetical protein
MIHKSLQQTMETRTARADKAAAEHPINTKQPRQQLGSSDGKPWPFVKSLDQESGFGTASLRNDSWPIIRIYMTTLRMIFHGYITSYDMWRIFLLVVILESQDLSAIHPAWYFQNIVAIFSPDRSRFETVLLGQLFEGKADRRHDRPPAVVTAVHADNRPAIPFPTSGWAGLCHPIQIAWEWLLPFVTVLRATNNSQRRSRPSASDANHESQEPLLRFEDPQIHGSYSRIVALWLSERNIQALLLPIRLFVGIRANRKMT